jgi:hypothetical protein
MTGVLENLLVGLLVAGSAIFSAWRLLSAKLRLRILDVVEPVLGKVSQRWVTRFRSKTLGQLAGGCGSCSRAPGTAGLHRRGHRPSGPGRPSG